MSVTAHQFRQMLTAQPFQPFRIRLADGRQMQVPHREFASMSSSGRTAVVAQPNDTFEIIDLLLVIGLEYPLRQLRRPRLKPRK
jgi:hypothetical protein